METTSNIQNTEVVYSKAPGNYAKVTRPFLLPVKASQ